ncbi:hypothetical protein GCM10009751_27650 [Myceligenerans crystallogenes]|uniref:MmyB-like transcription regulator ligand binding domain-containing protein n=2 Tax=Myceligenerans crystallogenes TaxID=316335 RepID=A0ABN2NH57_9MICO
MLAGVGASWYQWIEQGRAKNVSREVLESISHALQLDAVQHRYLLRLAGLSETPSELPHYDMNLLNQVVNGYQPNAAYIVDRYWNVLCANSAALSLFGPELASGNYLRLLFTNPRVQSRFVDWRREAGHAVSRFQAHAAGYLHDPDIRELTRELREASPEFTGMWDSRDVADRTCAALDMRAGESGHRRYYQTTLDFTFVGGFGLVLLTPSTDPTDDRTTPATSLAFDANWIPMP